MKFEEDMIVVEVEDEGFVAAGKTVAFPAEDGNSVIALTPEQVALANRGLLKTMTVNGNSLEGIGIYNGDRVIVKKAFSLKEIKRTTVCIVYLPAVNEVVAKRVVFLNEKAILQSCNDSIPDMHVKKEEIDIRGVVIGMVRKPDVLGRFDRGYPQEELF